LLLFRGGFGLEIRDIYGMTKSGLPLLHRHGNILHLMMHQTIGLMGNIGPQTLTLSSVSLIVH